jgi:hypothetical protein
MERHLRRLLLRVLVNARVGDWTTAGEITWPGLASVTVGTSANIDSLNQTDQIAAVSAGRVQLDSRPVRLILLSNTSLIARIKTRPEHQVAEAWIVRVVTPALTVQLDDPGDLLRRVHRRGFA